MLSLHRETLPRTGGSVGEDQLVLSAQEVLHLGADKISEDFLLSDVRLNDFTEGEVVLHLPDAVEGVLEGLGVPRSGEVDLELGGEEHGLLSLQRLGVGITAEASGDRLFLSRLRFDPAEHKGVKCNDFC